MKQDGVIRFSISLEPDLLKELDSRIISNGYSSRSELVRDMIRERLILEKWSEETTINCAVLTIIYDHHQRELNQRIIDIQHNASHNGVEILCTTHVHIDSKNCLETIMLRGKPKDIQTLSLEISGLKGVKFSELTKAGSF